MQKTGKHVFIVWPMTNLHEQSKTMDIHPNISDLYKVIR